MTLIQFLKGKILTFANYNSHFWLSPLVDAKVALIDDMTMAGWRYIDVYLRGGLDGNWVCIDSKHRSHSQIKFPPMIMTTNVDVLGDESLKYLHSRLQVFTFQEVLPLGAQGQPKYKLDSIAWQSFFKKFWGFLDLSDQEDDDEYEQTLRVNTRDDSRTV